MRSDPPRPPSASPGGPPTLADDRPSLLGALAGHEAPPGGEPPPMVSGPRYRVGPELGAGGMGAVYRVEDQDLGREVALKALRPELLEEAEYRTRFLQEARATGQLEHPNIVPLHDLGMSGDGTPYFTMKLVRGESLESVIDRLEAGDEAAHREFRFPRRLAILQEICDALEYAHSRGVLHRDLKPSNIMIGPYGEVIVLDWGIARVREEGAEEAGRETPEAPRPAPEAAGLTEAGTFLGTLGYAAPEQIRGTDVDGRVDVYALGVLMYLFLALRPPFPEDEGRLELLQRILSEDPPTPDQYFHPKQGRVPREVALIAVKAMACDRDRRYDSPGAVKRDIQAYLNGEAQVVCMSTGLKRSVFRLARLIDDHPIPMILLLFFLFLVPLVQLGVILALW